MKQLLNKMLALFVLALFLVSVVPLALADTDADSNDVNETEEEEEVDQDEDDSVESGQETEIELDHEFKSDDRRKKIHMKLRERLKIREDAVEHIKRVEIREHVKETQQNALEHRREVLDRAKMHREKMHDSLQKAREHYQEKKEELQDHKNELKEKREKLVQCKKESSEECRDERVNIRKGVIDQGKRNINFIIASFEKMKHRLDEASDISEADKDTIVTMIDVKLADLEAAREQFSALTDDATAEEIKEAAQNLRDVWQEMKPTYKWAVGMVLASKLESTVTDITDMDDRIVEKIEALEEEGIDMSEARDLLVEFEDTVIEADSTISEAQELLSTLDNAATSEEIKDVVNSAHKLLQDARQSFNEAKGILRKVFGLIKDAEHGSNPIEDTEVVSGIET